MKRPALALSATLALSPVFLGGTALACSSGGGVRCVAGATLRWDQPYYKPGEVARGKAVAVAWPRKPSKRIGGPRQGPYQVYLRPLVAGTRAAPDEDPRAVALGELMIVPERRRPFGTAVVRFTIPSVPKGKYLIEQCNAGCDLLLGNLLDTTITIVTTEAEERMLLSRRIESVARRVSSQTGRLQQAVRRSRRGLERALDVEHASNVGLEERVEELDEELRALSERLERRGDDGDDTLPIAVTGAVVLVASTALSRRPSKR